MTSRQHLRDDIVDVAGHFKANEHLRIQLRDYTEHTVPALHIDAYAEQVYQANKDADRFLRHGPFPLAHTAVREESMSKQLPPHRP
ncbi:hypothetical protein OKHIL_75930 [Mycolicibacterium mageritense]